MTTIEPGRLIATGRAADVFDQGDGTVLRRYRGAYDSAPEARLCAWLHEIGYPSPAVHYAEGPDMVMDLVEGPTMLEVLDDKPWTLVANARLLARLQQQLNEVEAPEWLGPPRRATGGPRVVHLDLHPMNVIIGAAGPTVIDWTNAGRGEPGFDAAVSYVVMATFEMSGLRDRLGQKVLVGAFRSARGRRLIREHLPAACEHRLADPRTTPGEIAAIERLR